MLPDDPYNETVRDCFENPGHAGDLQGAYAVTLTADAAESEHGARIALSAGIADAMIVEMRFRAWGCPHLIAAAEWLCRERVNGPVSGLTRFDSQPVLQLLAVPAEKTGRILLLEDASTSLWEQYLCAA